MKSFAISLLFVWMLPHWNTDFEKAKSEARETKKYILLNFSGSDWCIPCIKMKRTIFETGQFQQFAQQKLVLLQADFPRRSKLSKQNELLAEKYNPQGAFPFTLLLDAEGKVLKTWDGLPKGGVEHFIKTISQVVEHQ